MKKQKFLLVDRGAARIDINSDFSWIDENDRGFEMFELPPGITEAQELGLLSRIRRDVRTATCLDVPECVSGAAMDRIARAVENLWEAA